MSQIDRSQLIPDPQQPSRHAGGVQSPHPIAPNHSRQRGASNASQRPGQQHQQHQRLQQHAVNSNTRRQATSHSRANRNNTQKSGGSNKLGGKTTLFVVLGLVAIVYIVGVVAFSQVAYPNTTIAGVDISFSNASSAATKVNSAWKHYKLTVSGDDFSWTYQPKSDEPIVAAKLPQKRLSVTMKPLCGRPALSSR